MLGDRYEAGSWNALCDICGLRFKSSQLRKNWKGLMVDAACFESRHPQEFIRVRPERISVPWSRPEGQDQYLKVCYLWERTAYADLATADCAQADNAQIPYALALQLKGPTTEDSLLFSSIPGYAIPGYSIPGA